MKVRSPRNRTLTLTEDERRRLAPQLLSPQKTLVADDLANRIIHGDFLKILDFLPDAFVDLLILDPPYNLDKQFGDVKFGHLSNAAYQEYLESWFPRLLRLLKPHATV